MIFHFHTQTKNLCLKFYSFRYFKDIKRVICLGLTTLKKDNNKNKLVITLHILIEQLKSTQLIFK